MSLSKKYKAYNGDLSFAEWSVLYLRLEQARAARKKTVDLSLANSRARKTAKRAKSAKEQAEYVRVENRVDCFGTTKKGVTILGADASDGKVVARLCSGKVVSTYTSKRGERARIETTRKVDVSKLAAAGFTPKGF